MITQIHKSGDYQTDAYTVGRYGVIEIERFDVNGLHCKYPRIRVKFDSGKVVELDEHGTCIYMEPAP